MVHTARCGPPMPVFPLAIAELCSRAPSLT